MAAIFISYRREDSAGWTGRLAERLKHKFGPESIFMDIDTIQPGTDFAEALRSAVGACDVLLAIIGPGWYIAKNSEGQPRLEDPNDWVRLELTAALNRSIPVIPILVGGAVPPKTGALPDELKKLFQYQTHELTDKRWEYDSSQLEQVLEKVIGGAKPKRNITQTILTSRSTWFALAILGLLLAFGSATFLRHLNSTESGIFQKKEAGVVRDGVVNPTQEPEVRDVPVAANTGYDEKPNANKGNNQHSTADQQAIASTVADPNVDTAKIASSTGLAGQKGRLLPAGVEVKFSAGDLTFRLVSIRIAEQSNNDWLLSVSVLITNSSPSNSTVYGEYAFRLLIDNGSHAPTKAPYAIAIASNSEQSGELSFVVPKGARRVSLRVIYGDEQTTIPIDLMAGVSRLDLQPPSIPKSLTTPARMNGINGAASYDFRAVSLEPYNMESFLLRVSIRVMTNDSGFTLYSKNDFRLVFDDLSHEPVKGETKSISGHTYVDAEIVFIIPKPATRVLLRVKDRDNWRDVPIDLKAGKSQ